MVVPEWPQLVALKVPEMRNIIAQVTEDEGYEDLQPKLTAFSGKSRILEMQFLGEPWNEIEDVEKQHILNTFMWEMEEWLGDWVKEVKEFEI